MSLEKLIREIAEENHITAYEIAKNTSISINTARNILNNTKVKSKQKTLLEIINYLENAIVGTKGSAELKPAHQIIAAEPTTKYNTEFDSLKIDQKLNLIYNQNLKQQKTLDLLSNAIGGLILDFEEAETLKKKQKS